MSRHYYNRFYKNAISTASCSYCKMPLGPRMIKHKTYKSANNLQSLSISIKIMRNLFNKGLYTCSYYFINIYSITVLKKTNNFLFVNSF